MKTDDKELMKAIQELNKVDSVSKDEMLTELDKHKMLTNILASYETEKISVWDKIRSFVITYPWRVAFIASSVQSLILTAIFGTRYTNLFVGFFGG